ncbi:hypothetical protein NQ176_g11025 [Zarea fungicola]|uniref:Uncharacterized protein n=1 Tax=Zarea fungicola TaxID=93591 RepID=A0ACC1MCR8_9HYPO|nr:hypothetical protein NQ176_g11025 [Lecanicillium fungicola]
MDMKLLWFFTANTAKSFVDETHDRNGFGTTMQTLVVQEALDQPFLLKTLFALAGLHMQYLGQGVDDKMILRYRAEAFRDYRSAIENATPASMQALLANAVLIEVLPCDMFRDPETPDLYILDWILLWRGIHSVISLLGKKPTKAAWKSGTGTLLIREPLRIDGALDAVPVALIQMVDSITSDENDPDYPIAEAYRDTLSLLGALYKRLCTDDKYAETFRILTWVTFLPEEFIQATRRKAPRALVILGHYGGFLKLLQTLWWARGVGDRCIRDIIAYLGPEWHHEMEIPAAVSLATNDEEIKQILLTPARCRPIVGLPLLIPGLAEM